MIYRFNAIPIKILIVKLYRNRKYIQKFIWNLKGSQTVKKKRKKEQSWKSYACCFKTHRGRSQDGGGIGRGDHFLFYKFIERTTER